MSIQYKNVVAFNNDTHDVNIGILPVTGVEHQSVERTTGTSCAGRLVLECCEHPTLARSFILLNGIFDFATPDNTTNFLVLVIQSIHTIPELARSRSHLGFAGK